MPAPRTNYVFTSGTSILSNVESGHGVGSWQLSWDRRAKKLNDSIRDILADTGDADARRFLQAHLERRRRVSELRAFAVDAGLAGVRDPIDHCAEVVERFADATGLRDAAKHVVCAEGAAVMANATKHELSGSTVDDVVNRDDRMRLVSTDTDDGLMAAILVGWLLAGEITVTRIGGDSDVAASGSTLHGIGRRYRTHPRCRRTQHSRQQVVSGRDGSTRSSGRGGTPTAVR